MMCMRLLATLSSIRAEERVCFGLIIYREPGAAWRTACTTGYSPVPARFKNFPRTTKKIVPAVSEVRARQLRQRSNSPDMVQGSDFTPQCGHTNPSGQRQEARYF